MNIEYPTPEEQRAAARNIVKAGMPRRRPLAAEVADLCRSLGFGVVFRDMADVVFLSAMAAVCIFISLAENFSHSSDPDQAYELLFAMAPSVYLLLCLLGFWKERMSGTYDVKMSCKYTVCHLTAFRMLVFSCACIVMNLAAVGILFAAGLVTDYWQAFLVTASSLFLFSVLLLWSLFRGRGLAAPTLTAAAWVPVNLLLGALFGGGYGRFLREMPLWLHLTVALMLACLYCRGIGRLISEQKERILC